MGRNVSDDGNMLKETKLLMYSSRGNHGYVTKTDMFYAKQIILVEISEIIWSRKKFCFGFEINSKLNSIMFQKFLPKLFVLHRTYQFL